MMETAMQPFLRERVRQALHTAEYYLRTDVRYLLRGGFWLAMGQGVSMAAGFGLSLAFGNLVAKEVFGVYKFIFSLAGAVGSIAPTGIGTAVTQAVARGYEGALHEGLRTYFRWSIPSFLLTLGLAAYYYLNGNDTLFVSLLIVTIGSPLLSAFNLYGNFLNGKKDFRRNTLYGFFMSTVSPVALISIMVLGERTNVPLFIGTYYAIMTALSFFFHFRTVSIYQPSRATDPTSTSYGLHLSFMGILGRAAAYVDKILVFHFLGAASLAVYAFAAAPPQYVMRINGILKSLALPKLAARDIPTIKKTLPRKIAIHFVFALAATIGYIALAPYFFALFFPLYLDSIVYSQVLGLTILSAPGVWLGQTLTAHMRKNELYLLNTVSPIFKMGLYMLLIPLLGLWGVVVAVLATGFFGFLLAVWVFRRL